MIRRCNYCGKLFETHNRALYCSEECQREQKRNYDRSRSQARENALKQQRKKAVESNRRLTDLQLKADSLGMTYGQYQAYLFLQQQRNKGK